MSNYSDEVQKKLDSKHYDDNVLTEYDNYTYHIQVYMLHSDKVKEIDKLEMEKFSKREIDVISENDKYIIFESGVTPEFNIKKLSLTSVPRPMTRGYSSAITGGTIILEEVAGCQFCNQLHLLRTLLGYKNMLCPYYMDIWFSGYSNSSGKPNPNILGRKRLRFSMSKVKSDISIEKSTYIIDIASMGNTLIDKSVIQTNDIPGIELNNETLATFFQKFEDRLNDRYFSSSTRNMDIFNGVGGKKFIIRPHFHNMDIDMFDIYPTNRMTPESGGSENGLFYKASPETGLEKTFQDIAGCFEQLSSCQADISYRAEYIGTSNNSCEYLICIDVTYYKHPYIEWMRENNMNENNNSSLASNISTMQLKYIDLLSETHRLQKKYLYGINRNNITVLSLKTKMENLYYANTWNIDLSQVNNDSVNIQSVFTDMMIKNSEQNINTIDMSIFNSSSNTLDNNKKMYMTDIWNLIPKKNRNDLLTREVPFKWNSVSGTTIKGATSNNTETGMVNTVSNSAGFSNLFMAGDMCQIKIDIIGDPYWLDMYAYRDVDNPTTWGGSMACFYFNMKAFQRRNVIENNKQIDYDVDDYNDISGVYLVATVTSNFENGKFTQEIDGVIDMTMLLPSFVAVSKQKTKDIDDRISQISYIASTPFVNIDAARKGKLQDKSPLKVRNYADRRIKELEQMKGKF